MQSHWNERFVIRFGATFAANILRAFFSFLSGILIARGLGVSGYGDLNFLLGSFTAISQVLDMGTSSAFYTFISRRSRSRAFLAFYLSWVFFQFITTVLVVALMLPGNLIELIWVGQERSMVLLAFGASFLMTQIWGLVSQLGEAVRKTVIVQAASVAQALGHLTLVAAAVYWEWLAVKTVMWLLVGEYALLAVILVPRLVRQNLTGELDQPDQYRTAAKEFVAYCKPLVIYGCVGFLYAFADRWLLQQFGGSEQQGFFAISQQFANISLLVTTSILKVFWKEIAEAKERQDKQRMERLYTVVTRSLYVTGACISCLFIPYTKEILTWTVGDAYKAAWLCLSLMLLFSVYASLGQIQGVFFYASGETRRYAKIGLFSMVSGILMSYFLLAPASKMGLGLGAEGLAIRMVVHTFLIVTLMGYVIARTNGWARNYEYQVMVLGVLLSLGWSCKWIAYEMLGSVSSTSSSLGVMLLGSVIYTTTSLALFLRYPFLAGLSSDQVESITATFRKPRPVVA